MPNLKESQPVANQTGLPTGLLYEAATKALQNGGNGQMQKALEVGSYFLSGCMAYETLHPHSYSIASELLTLLSSFKGEHISTSRHPLISHQ
jgi:hypothetical protein